MKRLLFWLLLLASAAYAQTPNVTLSGTLQGPNGLPVANSTISFVPSQAMYVIGQGPACNSYILQVNGTTLRCADTINFNNLIPGAPTNGLNIVFQTNKTGGVDYISASLVGNGNSANCLSGIGTWVSCSGGGGGGSSLWSALLAPTGNLSIALSTYLSVFTVGDYGATPVTGAFTITDNATSATDTSVDLYVSAPPGSYHEPTRVDVDGFAQLQVCNGATSHVGTVVMGGLQQISGKDVSCANLNTSPVSKVWDVHGSNFNGMTLFNFLSSGYSSTLLQLETTQAAGNGFNLITGCSLASAVNGSCSTSNISFSVRGDGQVYGTTLALGPAGSPLPVSANGAQDAIAFFQGTCGITPTAGEDDLCLESDGLHINIGTAGLFRSAANLALCSGFTPTNTQLLSYNSSSSCWQPATGSGFTAGGDLSGTSTSQQVVGINTVPLCSGFTPTNSQFLQYTTASSPNPCYTASSASGSLNGQSQGRPTVGVTSSTVSYSPGAVYTSQFSGTSPNDQSGRIRAAFNACSSTSTGPCHVIIDETGTQTWSVQPFCKTSSGTGGTTCSNSYQGIFEFAPSGGILNILLDGVSTIQYGNGVRIIGAGETGSVKCANGGCGGSTINACNPYVETCANGGFVQPNCAISSTTYSAGPPSLLTVTCSSANAFNPGFQAPPPTNGPAACVAVNTPTLCYNNAQINVMAQYRYGCIAYSTGQTNNNGCNQYAYTYNTGSGNQVFAFYVNPTSGATNTSVASCASNCGTLYLDTPLVIDNNSGNNGGTYENYFGQFTLNCNLLPGCGGFVKSGGEELTVMQQVQVFNGLAYEYRFDQSPAYGAQINGDTNDGSPSGPFSGNLQPLYCNLSGNGCTCTGTNGACGNSVAGYAVAGSLMNCNSTNTSYAIMNPDPCLNSNHVAALFTGNGGNAMPGFLAHQTLSISAFNGIAVAEIKGCISGCTVGSQAVGVAVIGSGAHMQQPHEEYFNWGYQIGGDSAAQYTLWAAYEGGFTFAGTSKSISSATISSATAAQVTVSANSGFTPGASAVIAGITNASFTQLNGTWTVASISGSTLVNLTTSGLTTESATALSAGTATPSVTIPTAPTTSVSVKGGSQGPSGNYFDIGPGSGAINNVAGINLEDVNVGSGSSCPNAWIDNVTGHTALFGTTTDCVVSFHLGSGNNPPVVTGEGQGGFQGSVFYPPGQCVGGIGQTASTVYDIPPYVKGTGNSANICTYTGVPFGPKATHACVAQNLDASLSHTPGGSDTITFTLTDSTTATATLSCGINSSGTGLGQISTTECRDTSMSHTYVVKQGDIVYPTYYPSASSDATALDPRVSWDCQ